MFQLKKDSTFKAKVSIPRPGDDPAELEFVFKYRTRREMLEFVAALGKQQQTPLKDAKKGFERDLKYVMSMLSGWEIEDTFNEKNVALLIDNFPLAAAAIGTVYMQEQFSAKRGN